MDKQPIVADREVDLLVFGTGAAGLTAALIGAVEGLEVLLCEKEPSFGGTTATSGGTLWAPGSPPIARAGGQSDPAQARQYLQGELGRRFRSDMIDAFLESVPRAIEYLETHSEVRFEHFTNPDYHSERPHGSVTGHSVTAAPFDGRLLGRDFAMLSPPRDVFTVLGGLMVSRWELPLLLHPFSSWHAFRHVSALLLRHAIERIRYPRGTRLLIGNALVARFLFSLRSKGVDLQASTRLVELCREGDAVTGAVVECEGRRLRIRARRGVILATGGCPHSEALRREFMGDFPHELSLAGDGNTGDGITAARRIGAQVDADMENPAFWSPSSFRISGNGKKTVWIHGSALMDRGKPGLLAVNKQGLRFVNEADPYHDVVSAMFRTQAIPAYFICDSRFIARYGLGLVKPIISRVGPYVRDGYLVKAGSLGQLAAALDIDGAALERTVTQYNADAVTGVDTAFGRGSRLINRIQGDPSHEPNSCMAPLERPPFYGLRVYPGSIGTTVGLRTDRDARVLDGQGQAIRGLYACGNDMASVMRGFYPGPGITLGPAVAFAYRAMRHLVATPVTSVDTSSAQLA